MLLTSICVDEPFPKDNKDVGWQIMAHNEIFRADIDYLFAFRYGIKQEHFVMAFSDDIADLTTEMVQKVSDGLVELNASFEVHV